MGMGYEDGDRMEWDGMECNAMQDVESGIGIMPQRYTPGHCKGGGLAVWVRSGRAPAPSIFNPRYKA